MSKIRVFHLFFIASALCLIWFVFIIMRHPYIDIVVGQKDGKWYVTNIDPKSPVLETKLQIGAEVITIDGKDVSSDPTVKKWRAINQAKTILVKQNNEIIKINFGELPKLTKSDTSSLIEGLFSLLLALLLIKNVRTSLSARYLSLVFYSISLTFISLGASIRGDILGKIVIGLCMKMIPVLLIHFVIIFLQEKSSLHLSTKYFKYIYGFIFFNLFVQSLYFFDLSFNYKIHDIQASFELIFFSIGVIFDIIFLSLIYFKNKENKPYVSTVLKTIGVFFTISISPIVFFSFVSKIFLGYEWIHTVYTTWFILLFPLSFTYLLLSKKIYDIDLVIRRVVLTTAVSVIPSIIMVCLIFILFPSNTEIGHFILTFIFTTTILSVTLFSLEHVTTRWERIIFPRRHFLQSSLKKIAKKLGFISSMKELKELILVDIIEILNVSGGAIVFKQNSSSEIMSEGIIDHNDIENLLEPSVNDSELLLFELTRNQEYASYLVLTQKKTNTRLGSEELQWLNVIISYLSVSLENLFLIRKMSNKLEDLAAQISEGESVNEITWFRKLMFELQEKERFRIATDLHDTTMQDLFFLKRKLTTVFEQSGYDWEASEQVNSLLEYIDIINMNLRQNCFELHPYLLHEIGLVRTIEKIVELEKTTLLFEVEFKAIGVEFIEHCEMDMKRHLFRVFQELFNNAKKHSNASKVQFNIQGSNGKLTIFYRDDGVGFPSVQAVAQEIGGTHMGLEQIKSRILSMRGLFEIKSDKGSGVTFTAVIPLKEGKSA